MSTPDLLFVYGTLLTSAEHPLGDLLRARARPAGRGSIAARLYQITDPDDATNFYPGAVPSPDPADRVWGELYEVLEPDAVYPELDRFEACSPEWPEPHEFLLRSVEVAQEDGAAIRARTYLYTWDVSDARRIGSGRYAEASPDVR